MELFDLHIFIVNINNLTHTRNCIADLARQIDQRFHLTLCDNASSEEGTKEYLETCESAGISVIRKKDQVPLNHLWNEFYKSCKSKYICLLNNDIRLTINFTKDTVDIFKKEPSVGVVGHVSNNPQYDTARDLDYKVMERSMRQGWDMTFRKEAFTPIPEALKTFCGDDWLYMTMYKKGWKAAMALSSPIIHYQGASGAATTKDIFQADVKAFHKISGVNPMDWCCWSGFSYGKPVGEIIFKTKLTPLLTINMVTYDRHEDCRYYIDSFLRQTNPRAILHIWQDGPDIRKRKMVEQYPGILYTENSSRQMKYGHDMRDKSIYACTTPWWCTTNDDNWLSPVFAEEILNYTENSDIIKYAVAMGNLNYTPYDNKQISEGETDPGKYSCRMKVLNPEIDAIGEVDAASFIVRTDIMKAIGGWKSLRFEGDWDVYEKLLKERLRITRMNKVLQIHR